MKFLVKFASVMLAVGLLLTSGAALADSGTFVERTPVMRDYGINLTGPGGQSYTESVGGGTWHHGTIYILPASKQAYSNYYHATLGHRSSCRVGSKYNGSGWTEAGNTSYSQVTGLISEKSQAWWSTDP